MHSSPRPMSLLVLPLVLPLFVACSQPAPVEEPVRAVRTLTVQGGSSSLQHEYAAEIRPRTESRLSFRVGVSWGGAWSTRATWSRPARCWRRSTAVI